VASLSAKNRWCLTGTPIQNKLEDLGALVRFLRVPFLDTPSAFRNRFVQPIEAGSSPGFANLRTLLKCICIRRTKDLLQLPEPQTLDYKFYFSAIEQSRYSEICESYGQAIDDVICGRQPSEAYRTILQALLKLRMLCNHGSLQPYDASSVVDRPKETLAFLRGGSAFCVYCGGDMVCDGAEEDFLASRLPACSHCVCGGCIQQYQEDLQRLSEGCEVACPLCKVSLKEDLVVSGKRAVADGSQISLSETGMSTKLSKLLEDIKEHRFSDKWYGPLLPSIIYPE
jgi:SWI/SNF-related matrix-associated actin-dependent regulator of chromatin subfamily A3